MKSSCGQELYWLGCYRGNYDLISPDSVAHPAKMSVALCYRILQHLEELGLLKEGDRVLDPMGGTGMTNICAGAMGYPSVSVELEEKFIGFEKQNKEYAERKLYKTLDWQIIQGDSRRLSELLKARGLKSVMSPPYHETGNKIPSGSITEWKNKTGEWRTGMTYGTTEGQIGNLVDKPLKTLVSPPYGESQVPPHSADAEARRLEIAKERGVSPDKVSYMDYTKDRPLKSILSPPYANRLRDEGEDPHRHWGAKRNDKYMIDYGVSDGQIGQLPDKPLKSILSPPYEEARPQSSNEPQEAWKPEFAGRGKTFHSQTEGQIGKEQAESYLGAMKVVYEQIALVSDCLVVVVKNPTRQGKLRRLDLDTIAILEQSGWRIHCQHRALLFEELEQPDLFGKVKKRVKGRMSFFKRLSWQAGSPVASWEDVIFCVRG